MARIMAFCLSVAFMRGLWFVQQRTMASCMRVVRIVAVPGFDGLIIHMVNDRCRSKSQTSHQ